MQYFKNFVFICVLFCSQSAVAEDDFVKELRSKIVGALKNAEQKVFGTPIEVKPDPKPDNKYKCQTCKDKKFLVHGDGHKTPCPDCSVGAEPVSQTFIKYYTIDSCSVCKQWENKIEPGLLKNNWKIETYNETKNPTHGRYPYFEVVLNGKTYTHVGYLSNEKLKAIIKQHESSNR